MECKGMTIALGAVLLLTLTSAAQTAKFKVLHNFGSANDGSVPYGPLLLDPKGNLYGVTIDGGTGQCSDYGCGTVYKLTPVSGGGWKEDILHSFNAGSDGSAPWGGLLFDSSGNLHGTLSGDLSFAADGAFELSPNPGGWVNTMLYNGYAGPGLVFDKAGNLYGTIGGGDSGFGALGKLSPNSGGWTYAQLYSLCDQSGCPGGYASPAPPVWDTKGNLWGTMTEGGINSAPCFTSFGCGIIFEMTPDGDGTWAYSVMHEFASSSTDGQWPYGSLVRDAAGNFFGSTWLGGAYNHGTVFKFALINGKWQESVLYDFPSCIQGCMVEGMLAMDKAGNLYGTADGGTGTPSCGGFACGVVFKLAPEKDGHWKYSVLYNLTETTGGVQPFYGVILDGEGNLYGVTSSSGKYDAGTAFEITP